MKENFHSFFMNYTVTFTRELEIEADSAEEAEDKALNHIWYLCEQDDEDFRSLFNVITKVEK